MFKHIANWINAALDVFNDWLIGKNEADYRETDGSAGKLSLRAFQCSNGRIMPHA